MQQGDSDYIIAEGVDFVKVKEKVVDLKCLQKEQSREDVLAIKHEMQSFTNRIRVLESDLDNNQAQLIKVEREKKLYKTENSKLKQTCKTNAFISTMKTFWLQTLERSFFPPGMPMSGYFSATIEPSDPDLHIILTKLSKELSKKEKYLATSLARRGKKKTRKTPNTFLQSLWEKEKRRSNGRTNLDIWFHGIMKEINRQDLINRFHEMAQSTMIQRPSKLKKPKMSSTSLRSPGHHKSFERRKRRRFNSGPGTFGIAHTDSDQSSGFGDMEEESESSFTQFQILNKQMQKCRLH
ncbi:unnamed protein product [Mytilus edulis]|uniref:Uncharacterized protein n=1 Tax=Mytilus edulis TaxID=6550 RepID=A0A8S3PYS0_MYTED|nr:unnamed protein product [Mytilus edulis]